MDCGDGSLDRQNSIRSLASLMAFSVSVKTATAHCSLAGMAGFTGSLMAKPSSIQSPEEWARSAAAGCFVTGVAACGLEPSTRGSYMYARENQMYLDCHRASQAKRLTYCLRIGKVTSGW